MTDVIVAIEIIGYVQRITSKTSTMLFNKVLHQKVFIMSFKTQNVSREQRKNFPYVQEDLKDKFRKSHNKMRDSSANH